ncbi:MAG: hypothetical protein QOG43_2921 [Actinomycetota bacterium]|jgi:hypothetical protein|nr:hypothetical protein [Actinomycetota bacterium]
MSRPANDMTKGLAAVVGLLVLILAAPLALAHFVGWPLPTSVPGLDEVTAATRGGIDDLVVVKILALLAWLCWAQIAVAAVAEVTAVARGHAARRAPVLAGVQLGVGRLVATAALVLATWSTQRVPAVPLSATRLAVLVDESPRVRVAPVSARLPTTRLVVAGREVSQPAEPGRSYVVKKNDSWWAVAERTLGDGQRWKELRQSNLGRRMPDGSMITEESELLRPGWELLVPEEHAGTPRGVPNGALDEVEVRPGDNLWVMAERHLQDSTGAANEDEIRSHWETVIELNRDRFADPTNPSRIYTGQQIRMPSVGQAAVPRPPGGAPAAPVETAPSVPDPAALPAPPDSGPVTTTSPTSTVASPVPNGLSPSTRAPTPPPKSTPAGSASSDRRTGIPAEVLGTASTALAVGLAVAVIRRRRRRQLQLPAGVQPPTPPPSLDDLRTAIVLDGDTDQFARLHRALRDIAYALGKRRTSARPRLIEVTDRRIEVLFSKAVRSAPAPWRAEASGLSWELQGEPIDRDDDGVAPNPALVSIGRPDSGSELYLDLEAEGVVSLVGPADAVADVARSWILELATSPMASGTSVLVVGKSLAPASETSDRVSNVASWDEAETNALAWCEQSSAVLKANRWATPATGRLRAARADDLAPFVVFAEGVPAERLMTLAAAILDQQASVVLVAVGSQVEGALRMEVADGELGIPSLGLTCQAQAIPHAVAEQVDELLDDASRMPAQLSLLPQPAPTPPVVLGSATDEYRDPPFEILVRLLGDISVVGASRSLKPKQVAVLAYIALHAPVAADRVEDAVWVTPTASRRKRLANTVSETRNILGAGNLPIAVDGRYRVGPGVVTDLDLFERRLEYAAQQDELTAAVTLRGALELVDGPVFTYRNVDRMSYVWVDVDNWISTWELRVTDAAEDLVQRYLDLGDPDNAVWAARRGLNTCQTHARLTQLLAQAHLAGGDRMAAERVLQSHRAALDKLELDDDADDLGGSRFEASQDQAVAT